MIGHSKSSLYLVSASLGLVLLTTLAACGSSGANTTSAGSGGYSYPTAAAPASPTTAATTTGTTVLVATASVKGTQESILTSANGFTLYYLTSDTATTPACTEGCLAVWPPLILASGTPTGPASLTGTLSLFSDPTRQQVLYNGHLLYNYSGDAKAGDTTGEGIQNVWHVATPLLTKSAGGSGGYPGGY